MQTIPTNTTSTYIVTKIIDEIIVTNVLRKCFPDIIIYNECLNKMKEIQSSILDISTPKFDKSTNLNDHAQAVNFSSHLYRIKPNYSQARAVNSQLSQFQAKIRSTQQKGQVVRLYTQKCQREKQQYNYCSKFKQRNSHKRFQPCISSHQLRKRSIKHDEKQSAQKDFQESIRQFRQKLIFKPYYSQNVQKTQYSQKNDQKQLKKLKQAQPKKCLALTTDYDGYWVHLNKNDLNKLPPHYINVQAEVLQEKTEIEPIKNQRKSIFLTEFSNQHVNFKSMNTIEKDSTFTTKILTAMKARSRNESRNQIQQQENSPNLQIKLTGKACQPNKVGFHVFEKLKKSKCRVICKKEENIEQKKCLVVEKELVKSSSFQKKQSFREIRTGFLKKQVPQMTIKKTSNITLGSQNALHYLLKDQQKNHKKKVTIDSNFL